MGDRDLPSLEEATRIVYDELGRHIRERDCEHAAPEDAAFCQDCGKRLG